MAFRNYTPHDLNIILPDGTELVLPSEGIARVTATPGETSLIDGVPVADPDSYGEVVGLPEEALGDTDDYFIVSGWVGGVLKGSPSILVPGTGPGDGAIRENGRIVGVTRLKSV